MTSLAKMSKRIEAGQLALEACRQIVWKLGHNGHPDHNPGPVKIDRLDITVKMAVAALAKLQEGGEA